MTDVYRSGSYAAGDVARLYYRALGDGRYRRFEVNRGGGTIREVDLDADQVDPRVRRYADERAGTSPSMVEEVDFAAAFRAIVAEVEEDGD